jgi:hypothetical protein
LKLTQSEPGEKCGKANQRRVNCRHRHVWHVWRQRETKTLICVNQRVDEHHLLKPRNHVQRGPRVICTTEKDHWPEQHRKQQRDLLGRNNRSHQGFLRSSTAITVSMREGTCRKPARKQGLLALPYRQPSDTNDLHSELKMRGNVPPNRNRQNYRADKERRHHADNHRDENPVARASAFCLFARDPRPFAQQI